MLIFQHCCLFFILPVRLFFRIQTESYMLFRHSNRSCFSVFSPPCSLPKKRTKKQQMTACCSLHPYPFAAALLNKHTSVCGRYFSVFAADDSFPSSPAAVHRCLHISRPAKRKRGEKPEDDHHLHSMPRPDSVRMSEYGLNLNMQLVVHPFALTIC